MKPRPSVSLGLVAALVGLLVLGSVALLTGRLSSMVTSGVSMNPTYHAGDLVVASRSATYDVGDIVAYRSPSADLTVLHRIVGGDASGWVTKGDNNQSLDPDHPSSDQLIGRAVLHVPRVGAVVTSPVTRAVLLVGLLALSGALIVKRPQHRSEVPRPRSAGFPAPRPASSATPSRTRTAWTGLLALDAVLLAALALAVFAFPPRVEPSAPPASQTATIGYAADVTPSETYPSGRVQTGDPVYRRLVDALDISFRYRTDAPSVTGTARLDAVVSAADGWTTTVPLTPPAPLVDGTARLDGTLDLAAVQALADRVAAQTGVATGRLTVEVVGSGEARQAGGAPVPFSVELPLQVGPLTATLSGSPTDSPDGPVVQATVPFAAADAPGSTGGVPLGVRYALMAALLLAAAGTAMVWPTDEDDDDAAEAPPARAVGLDLSPSLARVELADHAQLQAVAHQLGLPVLHSDEGWDGVLAPNAWYWARTAPAPPVAPARPATATIDLTDRATRPLAPTPAGAGHGDPMANRLPL